MKRRLLTVVFLAALAVAGPLMLASPADARAGGGSHSATSARSSSRSSSSSSSWRHGRHTHPTEPSGPAKPLGPLEYAGIGMFALFFVTVIVASIVEKVRAAATFVGRLQTASPEALSQLVPQAAERDPVWREADLLQQARDAFMAVQNAWVKRDQLLARDVMTERLYEKHRAQTDAMIRRGELNRLDGLAIRRASIVRVADHLDDNQDEVWVKFSAVACDHVIHEPTGLVIQGDADTPEYFVEIWSFRRDGRIWRADAIMDAEAAVPKSFVEA